MIKISNISKTYKGGHVALKDLSLDIKKGEILALLGPNGAGKTTLISLICGIVTPSDGKVTVDGHDIITDYRAARSLIGLVPQELTVSMFETVWSTVNYSRGLFGKKKDYAFLEKTLKSLSLWDKKDNQIRTLSGGMKRRLLIAKALAHEPEILFLDEPTAGVDVELRHDMWQMIKELSKTGVTIILTTHYIEEAEEMADRIGVINEGELLLIEEKDKLIDKLGQKQMHIDLQDAAPSPLPDMLNDYNINVSKDGLRLTYLYDGNAKKTGINSLLSDITKSGLSFCDIYTEQSSLEKIFVNLVKEGKK